MSARKVARKLSARRAKKHGPRAPFEGRVMWMTEDGGHPTVVLFNKKTGRSENLIRGAKGGNMAELLDLASRHWPGAKVVSDPPTFKLNFNR